MTFSYRLYMGEDLIGFGALTGIDEGMATAFGTFLSTPEYDAVRELFEALSSEGRGDDQQLLAARERLALELRDGGGAAIQTEWIHIFDFRRSHGDDDAAEIDLVLKMRADVERISAAIKRATPQ